MEEESVGSGWDGFLSSLGNKVLDAGGTYLNQRAIVAADPAKSQYTVKQTPGGPATYNQAGQSFSGMSPIMMVGIALAALATVGVVIYAVKK